jgi:hypothetical protein
MAFKLFTDETGDYPHLLCDVCGQRINDFWNGKATCTPGGIGQISDVVVHHPTCAAAGTVSISLADFLKLFSIKNMIGDISSDGVNDKVRMEYPMGKGFEV